MQLIFESNFMLKPKWQCYNMAYSVVVCQIHGIPGILAPCCVEKVIQHVVGVSTLP